VQAPADIDAPAVSFSVIEDGQAMEVQTGGSVYVYDAGVAGAGAAPIAGIDVPAAGPNVIDQLADAPVLDIEYLDSSGVPMQITVEVSKIMVGSEEQPVGDRFEVAGDVYVELPDYPLGHLSLEAQDAIWIGPQSIALPEPAGAAALVACLTPAWLRRRSRLRTRTS